MPRGVARAMRVEGERRGRTPLRDGDVNALDSAPHPGLETRGDAIHLALAVDRDPPAAAGQMERQSLGQRLETAMGRWDAAGSEDGDGGTVRRGEGGGCVQRGTDGPGACSAAGRATSPVPQRDAPSFTEPGQVTPCA